MLHDFLLQHENALIARCRAKVLTRRAPRPTDHEIGNGIPSFLGQLIETLRSGQHIAPGPMVSSAELHGGDLQRQGFTVEQVVHDYGDLCQSITELAMELDSDISAREFGVLNRCLDDAIAAAVAEYARPAGPALDTLDGRTREASQEPGFNPERREMGPGGRRAAGEVAEDTDRLLGSAAFELQALLKAAMLSFDSIKRGRVAVNGSTGAALDRSLRGLRQVVDRSLLQLRLTAGMRPEVINVAKLITDIDASATLDALAFGIRLTVIPVDESLVVSADRSVLATVIGHLLQNAFKHTHRNDHHNVTLRVRSTSSQVRIDVEDECGGLSPGAAESLFWPFAPSNRGRPLAGELGLAICRRSIEAAGGTLQAHDRPTLGGCVFSVAFPAQPAAVQPLAASASSTRMRTTRG